MQPDLFAPFAPGSHTSWLSARSFTVQDRQSKTRAYLQLLVRAGDQTDPEASEALRLPRSSLCSIRAHLLACGLIEKSGETRESRYGRACASYQVTSAGRRVVQKQLTRFELRRKMLGRHVTPR